jgi:hypothetical protein
MDEDGFIYLVDRAKDMVLRGGENVYCAEVENALFHHDAVAECVAFAVPDERLGEEVGAAIYLKPGATLDADELRGVLQDLRCALQDSPLHLDAFRAAAAQRQRQVRKACPAGQAGACRRTVAGFSSGWTSVNLNANANANANANVNVNVSAMQRLASAVDPHRHPGSGFAGVAADCDTGGIYTTVIHEATLRRSCALCGQAFHGPPGQLQGI